MSTYAFRPKGEGHPQPKEAEQYIQNMKRRTGLTTQAILRRVVLHAANSGFNPGAFTGANQGTAQGNRVEGGEVDRGTKQPRGRTASDLAQQKEKQPPGENDTPRNENQTDRDTQQKGRFWDRWTK